MLTLGSTERGLVAEPSLNMNELEAFRRAVEIYRDAGWNSARPNSPTLLVGNDHRTIREICTRIIDSRAKLPKETIADLLQCLDHRDPARASSLKRDPIYASGARCLLKLLDDRPKSTALGIETPSAAARQSR